MDTMDCQTKVAKQIIDQGGDYMLSLKGNQVHYMKMLSYFLSLKIPVQK